MVMKFLIVEILTIIMGVVFGSIFPDAPNRKARIIAGFAYWLACQSIMLLAL